jgi:hypothetical protein
LSSFYSFVFYKPLHFCVKYLGRRFLTLLLTFKHLLAF